MEINSDQFNSDILSKLHPSELDSRLVQLEFLINERLPNTMSIDDFRVEMYKVIDELKDIGHDIWSWDYDGIAGGTWGGDYTKPEKMVKLIIEFHWKDRSEVKWKW